MDGSDVSGDDRTFKAIFTASDPSGVDKLRESVKKKLVELMGDYIDDTLVEYILVLLRNGRHKDEARKELNVFLGDETVPFISWLWDHLSSNLHLYLEQKVSFSSDLVKMKSLVNKRSESCDLRPQHMTGNKQTNPECEKQELLKLSRNRQILHNSEWKGLLQEQTQQYFLKSALNDEQNIHQRSDLPVDHPSFLQASRKRSCQNRRQPAKSITRDTVSQPSVGPSSRLLKSALRDVVRSALQTDSRTEPAPKRICSVVSRPPANDSLADKFQNKRPVSIFASKVMNASVEADEVLKVEGSGVAFARRGHDINIRETIDPSSDFEDLLEEQEFKSIFQISGPDYVDCYGRSEYNGELTGEFTMLDEENETLNNDEYGFIGNSRNQGGSSTVEDIKPFMSQYHVINDTDGKQGSFTDQELPADASGNAFQNIMNISVNVNTCKPPHYESLSGIKGKVKRGEPNKLPTDTANFEKDNAMTVADVDQEFQAVPSTPGAYSACEPCEDADSRIILINNVHFAATKDAILHHFKKFGEVLKVIIETESSTGQPKGSAFLEFLQKESADKALSLNGTYFMSRVLKVVKRNAARHESAPAMARRRVTQTSLLAPMLRKVAVPSGITNASRSTPPNAFQPRVPVKPGTRSLQWKRGASPAQPADSVNCSPKVPLPPRSFTYVRSTSKPDSDS